MIDTVSDIETIQHLEFQLPCEWTATGYAPECEVSAEWILLFTPCQCGQLISFYCTYHKNWVVKIIKNSDFFRCSTCEADLDLISVERI